MFSLHYILLFLAAALIIRGLIVVAIRAISFVVVSTTSIVRVVVLVLVADLAAALLRYYPCLCVRDKAQSVADKINYVASVASLTLRVLQSRYWPLVNLSRPQP
jgi:hypothetical protein